MIKQFFRFGIIGTLSTAVYMTLVALQVEYLHETPLKANLLAYFIAFWISYWGHKNWTFRYHGKHVSSLKRYVVIACSGLLLNETLYYVGLQILPFHYLIALGVVIFIVSLFTFTLSRLWAFR